MFTMGDGSVQFLSQTIDMVTYNRLGDRDDGNEGMIAAPRTAMHRQ